LLPPSWWGAGRALPAGAGVAGTAGQAWRHRRAQGHARAGRGAAARWPALRADGACCRWSAARARLACLLQELGLSAAGYPEGLEAPGVEVAQDGAGFVASCRQRLEGGGWLVVRSRADSLVWVAASAGPGNGAAAEAAAVAAA
jgi:hypothetical protein